MLHHAECVLSSCVSWQNGIAVFRIILVGKFCLSCTFFLIDVTLVLSIAVHALLIVACICSFHSKNGHNKCKTCWTPKSLGISHSGTKISKTQSSIIPRLMGFHSIVIHTPQYSQSSFLVDEEHSFSNITLTCPFFVTNSWLLWCLFLRLPSLQEELFPTWWTAKQSLP